MKRPSIHKLAKELESSSYEALGRKYGVSGNTIKKWRWNSHIGIDHKNWLIDEVNKRNNK